MYKKSSGLLYWLFAFFSSPANVRLPKIFGDGMVLQKPVAVGYAWTEIPLESYGANLYNKDDFPAPAFRTDD